jgi:tetratricopeptide (TPR) repeat protein
MRSKGLEPAARERLLAQLVPAAVAVCCYVGALANGFAYDDIVIVRDNYTIHGWATIPFALRIPYWYTSGHLYRPLATLWFALEWIASGGSPMAFHAVSIALHAAACALVARLALRWWSPIAAGAAGCVFAIHPVHVEAVANVVGQSELLCAIALLGLLLVTIESLPPGSARPSRNSLTAIGVLAAAATASKEAGVVAPAIAWAAAWLAAGDAQGPGVHTARRRAAWLATAASAAGVAFVLAVRVLVLDALAGDRPHAAFEAATPWQAAALVLASIPRALGLILVPQLPRPDYSPTQAELLHPNGVLVALGIVLVIGAGALLVAHTRRPTPLTLAAFFSVVTFAPVSNLLVQTGVVVAERTLYSPSVGVALAYGAGIAAAWKARRWAIVALACPLTVLSLILTVNGVPTWRDSTAVFAAIRNRAPASYKGYALSAAASDDAGDHSGARLYYSRALELFSLDPTVLENAGINALTVRDTVEALTCFRRALALDSTGLRARTSLAGLLIRRGDSAEARALLTEGLRRSPDQRTWRHMLTALDPPLRP